MLAIFRYGGLKLSVISGCMKRTKRRKNPQNQENKLQPDNKRSRKEASASESSTHGALFLESVVWSSIENDLHRCKQNKADKCSASI